MGLMILACCPGEPWSSPQAVVLRCMSSDFVLKIDESVKKSSDVWEEPFEDPKGCCGLLSEVPGQILPAHIRLPGLLWL